MCGIFVHYTRDIILNEAIKKTLDHTRHRGPDDSNILSLDIKQNKLCFGHNRLSILDTSSAGSQPMLSHSGRLLISFNGEIYNHLDIRSQYFNNFAWKSGCDTETLIECIELMGIEKTLQLIEGMFAFCVLDKASNCLYIARDLAGEKPLYLMSNEASLTIASDISNFKEVGIKKHSLNTESVNYLLSYSYIPTPSTIFNSIFKLPQSSFMRVDLNKFKFRKFTTFNELIAEKGIMFNSYFNIIEEHSYVKPFGSMEIAKNELKVKLKKAVKKQLLSDVPLGAFLSGGVDSSLICAIASEELSNLKTFNIGFEFNSFDESKYARMVSEKIGTDHINHVCTKDDAIAMIEDIPLAYSEPFADASQIPTMLISRIASQEVKVILTGDCGDELFGGYNRYAFTNRFWNYLKFVPGPAKYLLSKLILKIPPNQVKSLLNLLFSINLSGSPKNRMQQISDKLIAATDEDSFYKSFLGQWKIGEAVNQSFSPSKESIYLNESLSSLENVKFIEKMMLFDFKTYMTDDILCKVDRASMFSSIETRVPFLDKEVIKASLKVPLEYKLHKLDTKRILKSLLSEYLPENLIHRPKQGFGVPVDHWITKELKDWAEDLLSSNQNSKHNLFNQSKINEKWNEHKQGKVNNILCLWPILQFNQWYNHNL